MSKVTVAIRARPINERERASDVTEVIEIDIGKVSVTREFEGEKSFNFDLAYSSRISSPSYGDNAKIYSDIGVKILDGAIAGYNGCLFAYGQTGSGKSYTMTGYDDPGMIPRLTEDLFNRMRDSKDQIKVWVSYLEVYNEKIRDLLRPVDSDENLNIFEHQKLGVIVPDATVTPVNTLDEVNRLLAYGLEKRTSASTAMNATSSRSHSIYTLHVETNKSIAKINLIDLAGSERLSKSHSTGSNQKEASMINQSLTNLGIVIKALSEKKEFIPFRNSKLTFLLKDSLSGNSRTYMIAAISPAITELEETIGTLRFASSVKTLITNPHVNYGSHEDIVNALKAEIERLKEKLASSDVGGTIKMKSVVLKMIKSSFDKRLGTMDALSPKNGKIEYPYLLNISPDPLSSGSPLVCPISGTSLSIGSDPLIDQLVLRGIPAETAKIEIRKNGFFFTKKSNNILLNGHIFEEGEIRNGDVLTIENSGMYRLVVPDGISKISEFEFFENSLDLLKFDLFNLDDSGALFLKAKQIMPSVESSGYRLRVVLNPPTLVVQAGNEFLTIEQFENQSDKPLISCLQQIAARVDTLQQSLKRSN